MKKTLLPIVMALALMLALLAGCGQAAAADPISLASGGTLVLSVNPKIAVDYDETGTVTAVTARNDDAIDIIAGCKGLIGKSTRDAVTQLVTAIGDAGYFVEEIDGTARHITLEIEPGSSLPNGTFLDDVIAGIRQCVTDHDWATPLNVEAEDSFGYPGYVDTDYGPGNDGITDFGNTPYDITDYGSLSTDPTAAGSPSAPIGPFTDYHDTDYGPNNDGITDFGNTDYGPNNDGITDFGNTDYGPGSDGITDYHATPYDPATDYGRTPYDPATDYGRTPYDPATDYGRSNYSHSDYGRSDYD